MNIPSSLRMLAASVALVCAAGSLNPAWASSHAHTSSRQGVIVFRLRVAGTPARGEQFWAAYGPLAGRFGIVRLSASGNGMYQASKTLPLAEPTTVAYIAARGTIRTRAGLEPAHVLGTVAVVGPAPLDALGSHVPEWHVAVG